MSEQDVRLLPPDQAEPKQAGEWKVEVETFHWHNVSTSGVIHPTETRTQVLIPSESYSVKHSSERCAREASCTSNEAAQIRSALELSAEVARLP